MNTVQSAIENIRNLKSIYTKAFASKSDIGIIDYNAGNITSVERALKSLNIDFILSKNPTDLKNCDKLIFPGVGDAEYAMAQLNQL